MSQQRSFLVVVVLYEFMNYIKGHSLSVSGGHFFLDISHITPMEGSVWGIFCEIKVWQFLLLYFMHCHVVLYCSMSLFPAMLYWSVNIAGEYYSDVTWASWRPRLPATVCLGGRSSLQKGNHEVSASIPLCEEKKIQWWPPVPITKGQHCGKSFCAMMLVPTDIWYVTHLHLCYPYPSVRSNSQIPICTRQVSHNAPICNRNVQMCAHFCYKLVHCRIWV